ncbi:LysR family transcriptional regulator [Paraburkholderia oxyphila]|uniref:LysR family transcriptional regulator n=1 Tax=Paraburkholderia oxyphila TaxID=614212 RepID=UPI00047FF635|nr:LysR family transcriptional regulator [Paraburkholderia oxyphila]
MDLSSIDLNLLVAFDAIAKERNITLAATRIGRSQPATSAALSRLRKIFNDPLFVRTIKGMQPTPYAEQLVEPISRACDLIAGALQVDCGFDPLSTTRKTFTVYMNEIAEVVCLPKILQRLQTVAPGIGIKVSRIPEKGAHEAMASGEVDLAFGVFSNLKAGFFQQRLYTDRFVCIARGDHPSIGAALSLQEYLDGVHVTVASTGTGHDTILEQVLAAQHLERKVALTVPHFLVLPVVVAQTNAIATVPYRMVSPPVSFHNIRVLETPVPFPQIEIRQHWHERYHHDAANKWLRQLMVQLFSDPRRPAARAPRALAA